MFRAPRLLHCRHGNGSLGVGNVSIAPQLRNGLRLGVELDALLAVAEKLKEWRRKSDENQI